MGVGALRIEHHHWCHDALTCELGDRGERPLIGGLGKDDTPARHARAYAHRVEEGHPRLDPLPYFARRALATAGWTRSSISPPNRATSRTRLALMYVVSRDGTMNTVSRPEERWRFMSAI